jgi:hypothetical protein
MAITVTLRVVGIQFNVDVVLEKANPSIREVMEAARGTPRDFNFISAPDGSLFQASAKILVPSISISSGRSYQPGLYSLADNENVGTNSITTWQWYLIRDGKQINQPNQRTEKFNLESPVLQDKDTIIWRLVVVAAQASISAKISSFDNKAERTTVAATEAPVDPAALKTGQTKTAHPGGRTSYKP